MRSALNIILVVAIFAILGWIVVKPNTQLVVTQESSPMPSASVKQSSKEYTEAKQVTKVGKSYTALIHTSVGDIAVALSKATPATTNNFVFLAQEKFYDGVIFHRVIPGFMIQGGDPTGSGMGGPGYKFADEPFKGEYKRGVVAMANSGPNTNGSQFFIMHADYPLPPNYVIFGMVTSGLEVVDKIATGKTGPNDRPVAPVSMTSIEISEK